MTRKYNINNKVYEVKFEQGTLYNYVITRDGVRIKMFLQEVDALDWIINVVLQIK